jgi:hypothetical protein
MQLTANLVILATALTYSSSVLALPLDVAYDLEVRDAGASDALEYDAREYQEIEMQAREYFEDLDARAATVCASLPPIGHFR